MEKILSLLQSFLALPLIKNQGETLVFMTIVFFVGRLLIRFVTRYIKKIADDGNDEILSGREKRAATIAGMFKTAANIGLFLVLAALSLSLFGVNASTILGAAGILSFAVGFGTQTIIKDLVAGMFIFAENQFAVGDHVKINDKEGIVKRMSVRTTTLEIDAKADPITGIVTPGCFIFIANGGITSVCNYSLKPLPEVPAEAPLVYEEPATLPAPTETTTLPQGVAQ